MPHLENVTVAHQYLSPPLSLDAVSLSEPPAQTQNSLVGSALKFDRIVKSALSF